MSIHDAMRAACAAVHITPPGRTKVGEWVKCPAEGKGRSNGSGRVLIFDDGTGGICWNWTTSQQQRFTVDGIAGAGEVKAPPRDQAAERLDRDRRNAACQASARIVAACRSEPHAYLERKGFPDECGLVIDSPADFIPADDHFDGLRFQIGKMTGPFLIVPGRIAKRVVTVQMIDADGAKLNMKSAPMKGASHRIATGRETWVCEGIATALSVRAALRFLSRSATVLSAFSASNVGVVAKGMSGSVIAADHDKPLEQLHGKGTGEFYADQTGRAWTMPPEFGDFNDMHQRDGLRAVAVHLMNIGRG